MPKLRVLLLPLLLLVVPAANSESAPIVFNFTAAFASGDLAGQNFEGSFSVDGEDCPGGLCPDDVFDPNDPAHTLLSFDITVDGATFDIEDDADAPNYPQIYFGGGLPSGGTFITDDSILPSLVLDFSFGLAAFTNADELMSRGTITDIHRQAVPEPVSLSLLGLGLAAMGARRCRQRRNP